MLILSQKTIFIKLFAGLGNQLFQYAYGQYLKSQGWKVSYLLNQTFNKYGQCIDFPSIFNIPPTEKKSIFMPSGAFKNFSLVIYKIITKYVFHCYSTGFYQKAKFVENVKTNYTFLNESVYKQTSIYKKIIEANENAVFIHVRGGDYHKEPQYDGICTSKYYADAISKVKEKINHPIFFVFTNDLSYAKTVIQNIENFVFIDEAELANELAEDPGFDLFLMSSCNHAIIANSTYSWWGAFLQKDIQNHIVIYPSQWNNADLERIKDIIPDKWKTK